MTNENDAAGGMPTDATQAQAQPQLRVIAQYIKDFSFENPKAPDTLRAREKSPSITINVNVGTRQRGEDTEVELKLDCSAVDGTEQVFKLELSYAGLFRLVNVKPEHAPIYIMVECPRLLFPFARQIVADTTRNGGFPPLMLDPIDFVALYQRNAARAQQQRVQAGGATMPLPSNQN